MLYGPNAVAQTKRSTHNSGSELVERARGSGPIAGAPNFSGERQYLANMRVKKFGLDGSFNIYIFLGDKPGNDSSKWTSEPSFVGLTGIFTTASSTQPGDVKATLEVNGVVPLTPALEAKVRGGELSSMQQCAVAAYLKANLRWRISKVRCGSRSDSAIWRSCLVAKRGVNRRGEHPWLLDIGSLGEDSAGKEY